ncbi:hypothetical protein SK128_003943 [Halocaridina rubra]|uniref:C-type lectin domain-containing protein n=1 Tax=Halocaridina rubra TaxID=373956 RepID=A0AAN9ACH6_HALRR
MMELDAHKAKDMVYEQHLSATSVWIGMKNDVDGNRWLDGTPVTFFNYADGEPNSGGYTEPCIEMYTGNGEWNDAVCDKRIPFICEKKGPYYVPIQPPPPPSAQCPEGWEPYNNHCYYLSPDSVDWDTANNWCQNNLGSQLISILDADENAYVTYISQSIWANIWLGLHDDNFGNNWHWLDGSPLEYQNWIEGEPNNENGVEHCGEIRGIDYYGMWNDFPCNNVNRYICKITIKTCPAGFTYNNKKCYYTTTLQETWDVARQKCKEFGNEADLVSIHNDEENYYFGEILGHTSEATWIGLRYDNNSQIWSWSDGKPTDYFHWNGGEPNELQAEFCGEMIDYYGTETHSKWNNLRCNEARTYGCEYYPTHSTGCEENWTYFNNYCYYYSNYDYSYIATDFDSAEADCVSKGAHLASIHTPEENDFVFSLLSSDSYSVWVGITDYGNSGNIEWSDGTSISFTKWDVMWSYPFQYSPACAYLYPYSYNGQWYLDACVYYNFYVCKKAMEPIPINPVSNGCHEVLHMMAAPTVDFGKIEEQVVMRFFFLQGKGVAESHCQIKEVLKDDCPSYSTVPNYLKTDQERIRVMTSKANLDWFAAEKADFMAHLVIMDET